ncbi:MAG: CAP domain-containing protein [Bacteroidota bacterium]
MKKINIYSLIAFSLIFFSPNSFSQSVNKINPDIILTSDTFCTQYSAKEFLKLERLNKPIDFEIPDIELLNAAIFHLTNKERKKRKKTVLVFSTELCKAARFHSEQMRDKRFFSHKNIKDKEFYSPGDRIKYFGGKFNGWGENISKYPAVDYREIYRYGILSLLPWGKEKIITPFTYLELAESMVKGWMGSYGHRKNILHPDFRFLGYGVALHGNTYKSKKKKYAYATQNFGG